MVGRGGDGGVGGLYDMQGFSAVRINIKEINRIYHVRTKSLIKLRIRQFTYDFPERVEKAMCNPLFTSCTRVSQGKRRVRNALHGVPNRLAHDYMQCGLTSGKNPRKKEKHIKSLTDCAKRVRASRKFEASEQVLKISVINRSYRLS